MSNDDVLKRLRGSLKQLKSTVKQLENFKKIQEKMADDIINKLPEDKRGQYNKLLNDAKNGKCDISNFISFMGDIKDADKEELKKTAEETIDKIDKKE